MSTGLASEVVDDKIAVNVILHQDWSPPLA